MEGTSVIGWDSVAPVMEALATQINVTTIIAVLAGGIAACAGIVFMWWAARKGIAWLMGALRKGRMPS